MPPIFTKRSPWRSWSSRILLHGSWKRVRKGETERAGRLAGDSCPDQALLFDAGPLPRTISARCMPHSCSQKSPGDRSSARDVIDGTKLALFMPEVKLRAVLWFAATLNENPRWPSRSGPDPKSIPAPPSLKGSRAAATTSPFQSVRPEQSPAFPSGQFQKVMTRLSSQAFRNRHRSIFRLRLPVPAKA